MNKIKIAGLFSIITVLCLSGTGFADEIYLKSGKIVKGEIIEETAEYLKVRVENVIVTYNMESVSFFEEKEMEKEVKEEGKERIEEEPESKSKKTGNKSEKTKTLLKKGADIIVPTKDFPNIKEAIKAAKPADVIYVNPGSYDEGSSLILKSGIKLYGAGADKTEIKAGKMLLCSQSGEKSLLKDVVIEGVTINLSRGYLHINSAENILIGKCIIKGGSGISVLKSANVEISNCTIANLRSGVIFRYPPVTAIIRNSIIANCGRTGILISAEEEKDFTDYVSGEVIKRSSTGEIEVSLYYNDIWGHYRNFYDVRRSVEKTRFPGEGNISEDPRFIGDGDYRLSYDSPCIDSGDPAPEYKDKDGSRGDMGALPYLR